MEGFGLGIQRAEWPPVCSLCCVSLTQHLSLSEPVFPCMMLGLNQLLSKGLLVLD